MVEVKLYHYTGENIRANKAPDLDTPVIIQATQGFEGNQNLEAPAIIIESATNPSYNYCYITEFSRYYYVVTKTWLSGNLWRLTLMVDPLYSHYADVIQQKGIIMYSGLGSTKKYDPRLVYNEVPERQVISATVDTDGGDFYILMTCRFSYIPTAQVPYSSLKATNQMSYILMSGQSYAYFINSLLTLHNTNQQLSVAVSNTIVSVSLVKWFDVRLSSFKNQSIFFSSPKIFEIQESQQVLALAANSPEQGATQYTCYQCLADEVWLGREILFPDTVATYADRKAERLLDIPFVGQLSIDVESLGLPANTTDFNLAVNIRYDLGGNQYVVIPGYKIGNANTVYCNEEYTTFTNGYTASFTTDSSYAAETETRMAQILSMLGTVAMGVVSGIMTEGATVPATIASLGIGASNFALNEQKLKYQKASSLVNSGSSNGGSAYNALQYLENYVPQFPRPKLIKKISVSATAISSFSIDYGKPDGAFRQLSSLVGTGFCQMGTVIIDGISSATNNEKNEIKAALMSGVIL